MVYIHVYVNTYICVNLSHTCVLCHTCIHWIERVYDTCISCIYVLNGAMKCVYIECKTYVCDVCDICIYWMGSVYGVCIHCMHALKGECGIEMQIHCIACKMYINTNNRTHRFFIAGRRAVCCNVLQHVALLHPLLQPIVDWLAHCLEIIS